MRTFIDMTFSYHQFKELLEDEREEDGFVRKIYIRNCRIHSIPFGDMEKMKEDLKIKDSLFKKCHFMSSKP